jgi:hypothetical protein
MSYVVTWEIELDADSPVEAAKLALAIQRDPNSIATVFKVFVGEDTPTTIDLTEEQERGSQ